MKSIPIVTIVGAPNTGKSTLFNRISGRRKALVHSAPGMTRDIFRLPAWIEDHLVFLQDSGGFFPADGVITEAVNQRVLREADRSNRIVFLFDGKREMLGYEKELFLSIRRRNPDLITVINKIDNPETHIIPNSYYELGVDLISISAEHDLGIEVLRDLLVDGMGEGVDTRESESEEKISRISVVGKPNVGKSSLINRILNDDYLIVSPFPGTTRDSIDLEITRDNKRLILVDNAGIRKLQKVKEDTESVAVLRAQKDIHQADMVIFVVDVSKRLDQNDLFIASQVVKSTKPVIIAANKWDLISGDSNMHRMEERLRERLHALHFAPIHLVSAATGKNVLHLLDSASSIDQILLEGIRTPHLNTIMNEIYREKKLMTREGKPFKSKYATIESRRPLFVQLHTRHPGHLKPSDEMFLKKRLTEKLKLLGIPIYLKISVSKKK